ncbi:hypothetical protein BCU30_023895 [Vibrio lentus]|jgi:hypothetical protein|uniref:Uncharacterized protein n=1 Tax=Vibrio kanaloae TaxID=170673 RepID=A0ABV4LJK2_9VIBR|nr:MULTISPECIES: hypothetical protein [Vibrio]MCT4351223.1 hypothetical protein [Vibrio sp. NC2]OEF16164.1 hypothetical protein A132_05855 [Vibrio kanaloae 5S-149]PMF56383.1 hypothetical protein BCV12_01065 [Vibrio cyclitrophicus]PMG38186.1 hypothetical protein BCU97_09240 [Vibrio splendidus]PMJ09466.1 hypothetical protein BCU30_23925 [Vibrio lentus]
MFGAMTSLTGGGGLTGGSAGPSTATSSNQSGQSIGGINMGGGVSPWLILAIAVLVIVALKVLK